MKKFFALLTLISVSLSANAHTLKATDLAASDAQIVAVKQIVPDYPNAQLLNKRSGNVTLTYDLDEQGKVTNIALVENTGPKQFVHTSMKALRKSRFQPVLVDAQAVSVKGLQLQYDYHFEAEAGTSITDLIALNR